MTFEEANEFYESTRRKLRTYERLGKEMSKEDMLERMRANEEFSAEPARDLCMSCTHSLECLCMIDKHYKIATCKFFQDDASGTKYYI